MNGILVVLSWPTASATLMWGWNLTISGLVGVNVTVPNIVNMLNVLDWACLAPRPRNRLAEPCSATGYKAPPAAASALSTPPI
jgi:hypothetical protein